MADFSQAYKKLIRVEGDYVNDADDCGLETYCGISRRFHPDWEGWVVIDVWKSLGCPPGYLKRHEQLARLCEAFYWQKFWAPLRLDAIFSQPLAEEIFDSAVNLSPARAVKWLQESINLVERRGPRSLAVDGQVGARTIAAVNSCPYPGALLKSVNGLQFMHYYNQTQEDPSQLKFFRGWLTRVWEQSGKEVP